jgi:hypothetical protein
MGCGASSAAPLTVDVEAREGCDPRYDDLVGESPTLSNAFEKRRRFEAMMSEAMHGRATEGLGSAFDLWATHAYYQRTIKQVRGRFMHMNMAAAFAGWVAKVQESLEKKRKEQSAIRLLKRLMNMQLAHMLDAWREFVEIMVTVKAARSAVYLAADRAVEDAEEAKLERMDREQRAQHAQADLEDRSARYIQARYRGRLARNEMKEQHKAASKIASNLKGRMARRALKERKPGRGLLRQPTTMNMAALGAEAARAKEMEDAETAAHKLSEEKAANLAKEKEAARAAEEASTVASAAAGTARAAAAQRLLAASQHGQQSALVMAAAHAASEQARELQEAAVAEQHRLEAEEARLKSEKEEAEKAMAAARAAEDEEALKAAEEAQRIAKEAQKAAHEAEERAKAEAERLRAEAEAARLAEEAEAEKARLQAEADERARVEAEKEAARLEAEAEAKRLAAEAELEAQRIAEEEARVAAEAERAARRAAAIEMRLLRIKEDAQRAQMYLGGKDTSLISRRMPGTVRDSGVARDSSGKPERFADKDLEGRWTGAGLTKRVDLMAALPLVPTINEDNSMDEAAVAKAEKKARSKRKKTYNGMRWIAVMLSEPRKPPVPVRKGGPGEPDEPARPAEDGALVAPTPDINDFVPGVKPQALPPVPAVTACLEAGLVPAVLALLEPGIDYGPEFPAEMWQLMAMWILTNICSVPEPPGLERDEYARRQEREVSESGVAGVLVECGALPLLVRHVDAEQQESANVREHAVWVLGQIAAVSIPLRDAVLDAGALQPILGHFYSVARRISSSASMGAGQWGGPLEGVLAHGESIEIQHWARWSTTTLAVLCTTRDEELTDQTLPVWAYLIEEDSERILKFSLSVLRMLSEGSLKRLKAVVDTRAPARILTLQQREELAAQDRRARDREMYEAMAASPLARATTGERGQKGVVDRLVELLDFGGSIKVQSLQVISNICIANSYVATTQDRFVEEVQTSGVGSGNSLKRLLGLMLSADQTTSVMAVRVLVNMLAGTQTQVGRVIDLDCTCAAIPVGHVFPILLRWLVGSAKPKAFAGSISLHGDRAIGQTVVELTEAAQAICNASWSRPEHVQYLLRQGCLDALLTMLSRIHPLHGLTHHEMSDTDLENHEDIQDNDGVIVLPALEALANFIMWEQGANESHLKAAKAEREEDKGLDEGTILPPGWKKQEDSMGQPIYINVETDESSYDFPRETEEQRMARRKKRKEDHLKRIPKPKGKSSNDVSSQRARLLAAGFDALTIDNMIHQKKLQDAGSHLGVHEHILQHGREWAEAMGVLEKPTMTELMARSTVVLGRGTELLQSYLVHKNPLVVEGVVRKTDFVLAAASFALRASISASASASAPASAAATDSGRVLPTQLHRFRS